ncbi:MAG: hypothetical protein KJO46_04510, partial [Gammaproteobacteria bacterium]|nr:hypothetical protein [Gammaproteobacteria bacterium]
MTCTSLRFAARAALQLAVVVLTMLSGLTIASADAAAIDRQRQLFMDVIETVERGDWSAVSNLPAADRTLLQSYVLWPDLKATYLRNSLRHAKASDIDAFLQKHGTLRPARELRYRYALYLARTGDLEGYRQIYERFYQGQQIAKLDCLAAQAVLAAGHEARFKARGTELWLTGKSQVSECDSVFEHLRKEKQLGGKLYRQRYELAIDAREFRLARWLAKSIDRQHLDDAGRWRQAQTNPEDFLERFIRKKDRRISPEQLVYAVERLTYRDPELALNAWQRVTSRANFSADQRAKTLRHIALWSARDNLPGAYELLVSLRGAAVDSEVSRWRARTSLRNAAWELLLEDIAAMPDSERDAEEWRYWQAVALKRLGQVLSAHAAF